MGTLLVGALGGADSRLLSFDELVALFSNVRPSVALESRLNALLTTPFVCNAPAQAGIAPHPPDVEKLGPILRVAFCNTERGLNFELIRSLLSDPAEFGAVSKSQRKLTPAKRELVELQLRTLRDANVPVLNEVDVGMKRTEYRDVARDLATALHMNYAYAVEFIEVDPIFELGTEQVHLPDPQQDQHLQEDLKVDRLRYKGLHGTARMSPVSDRQYSSFSLTGWLRLVWKGDQSRYETRTKSRLVSAETIHRENRARGAARRTNDADRQPIST